MYEIIGKIAAKEDTTILKIWYPPIQNYACMKKIKIVNDNSRLKSLREINMLSFLRDNPNCIQLYECTEIPSPENSIVLITEFCETGNLLDMGNRLKEIQQDFSRYIVYFVKKSIKFLKSLQDQQISHRDIKPENIFIDSDWDIKFGDFGSSTSTVAKNKFTIQGSPYYLSPELREGYHDYQYRKGDVKIVHSPFKSDVYSLGLIFLHMLTMQTIDDRFLDLEVLEANILDCSEKIEILYLRDLVRWMLGLVRMTDRILLC